jgi:hypothetical protein
MGDKRRFAALVAALSLAFPAGAWAQGAGDEQYQDPFGDDGGQSEEEARDFLFRAHPVSMVYGGPVFWEARHAAAVMRAYRDYLPTAPGEFGFFVGLKRVPSVDPFPRDFWGVDACAIIGCYNGSKEDGQAALAPLLEALPEPIFNWVDQIPFPAMQSLFDPFFPKGLQWYWKGDFVKDLPDEAIDIHIAEAAKAPSELSLMHLYPIDGAVRRVGKDETAWAARDARWSMVIAAIDSNPQAAGSLTRWGRTYWEAVHRFNPGGAYVNFMMDDEDPGRVMASYGDNYGKLAAIKGKYDPANLFHVNQNIQPAR